MKMIETKTVTMAEALGILSRDGEEALGYEQKITLDYLRRHSFLLEKDVKSAKAELDKIEGLKEHQITMLLDLLPETEDDVKVIFMKERINVEKDQIKKILEALDKVRPDAKKIKAKRAAMKKAAEESKEEKKEEAPETE